MATVALPVVASNPLRDRYELEEGAVFLSGVQALVRLILDQYRADRDGGARTGTMVSGYQGSPLGGFDREIARLGQLATDHGVVHRPGVNEELGATAVWGSQMATGLPGPRYDGVLGVWYGKAPGVDRAADAIRHGNFAGTDPRGGVLALCGDDPECKSSTLPSASEAILAALEVPVLAPGSVQDAYDLGRHGIGLSRASGLWAALKVVTAVADATADIRVGPSRVVPVLPQLEWEGAPYVHRPSAHLLAPQSLEMERTLREIRLPLALEYSRANRLNEIVVPAPQAKVGIVAAGAAFEQLRAALADLGVHDGQVRLLRLGMLFPLDAEIVREFARGLDEVIVLEEKGPFLERLVKDALYGAGAPPVSGKSDASGAPLVPSTGVLSADRIARAVGQRLLSHGDDDGIRARLDVIQQAAKLTVEDIGAIRAPHFCSGCPHNSSAKADDDQIVGAGIGCHTLVMLSPQGKGAIRGTTQMGGEGIQWVGAAPFVEPRHYVQNLGDGTLHHSGSLAIRAAVAAGLDVTYKILYNGTVAMTGGQHVAGQMTVKQLAESLAAEGVARVIVTTDDTAPYRDVSLPAVAEVRGRGSLRAAQRELAEVPGVTVLIHDQACATELRRARKRGRATEPPQQVIINERVCEGCGDCGEKSGCLSVEPVETEFGRKTRIHQSSCNKDFSCLEGDCPSFIEVVPAEGKRATKRQPPLPDVDLPEPALPVEATLRLVGIGGTGVVTVSQVLGVAAMLDGFHTAGLDQTGLSQKAGPVSSDVRISPVAVDGRAAPSAGGLDALLGFDIVATASAKHLAMASPDRTVAIVSTSVIPTASMVIDVNAQAPDVEVGVAAIERMTRESGVFVDAQELAMAVFGDHMPGNLMMLGAAWQRGVIPVSLGALRHAIKLNGAAVAQNLAALEWGRAVVAAPDRVAEVLRGPGAPVAADVRDIALIDRVTHDDGELRRLLMARVPDLRAWGGASVAAQYVDALVSIHAREAHALPGTDAVTVEAARGLYKLLAYKDEYEVARLHLEWLAEQPKGTKVHFLLHPPALRAMGMDRKIRLGRWFTIGFRMLRAGRRLRGTALDLFGRAEVRRVERALPAEYLAALDRALDHLDPGTADTVLAVARTPDLVRGYEDIKLRNVERFRTRLAELDAELV
jgi:indolepyruvate ferredoxin oxidoreductase